MRILDVLGTLFFLFLLCDFLGTFMAVLLMVMMELKGVLIQLLSGVLCDGVLLFMEVMLLLLLLELVDKPISYAIVELEVSFPSVNW